MAVIRVTEALTARAKAISRWLINPWQLTLGADHHPPFRWWRMRPLTLFAIIGMFLLAIRPAPPQSDQTIPPPAPPLAVNTGQLTTTIHHQQMQLATAHKETAQAQADLAIANARADALAQRNAIQAETIRQSRARFTKLEAILDARKSLAPHLINGQLARDSEGVWQLDITMVRAGSHRSLLHASLQFFANGHLDQPLSIQTAADSPAQNTLAVEIETHAFIHAQFVWPAPWPVRSILVIATDNKGRQFASATIRPVTTTHKEQPQP